MNVHEKIQEYLGEDEINEIFRLKKEEAAKKAKAKIKAVADDIQRAIKRHGEDSKTVQYLRAKKKRMQQQFAHAMGESLDEKYQELIRPELKSAFGTAHMLVKDAEQQYKKDNIRGALQSIDKLEKKTLKRIVEILKRHKQ